MLLRLLAFFFVLWIIGKSLRPLLNAKKRNGGPDDPSKLVQDPACGVYFDPRTSVQSLSRNGRTDFFCSQNCYEAFCMKHPDEGSSTADPPST